MIDHNNRNIDYLRISVTDRCNLRCRYCMPEGISTLPMKDILTFEEIRAVVEQAAELGLRHFRLTGGEPTVRIGLPILIREIRSVPGIEKVSMTTNGILLEKMLPDLISAGLDSVNISLDTMNREKYLEITGTDGLETVLSSVRAACSAGLKVKVNAVSLFSDEENIRSLIDLARELPVDVRFIEMMPVGYGRQFPGISHNELMKILRNLYPGMTKDDRVHGFGPAVYYRIPGYRGSVGLISAIHGKFCSSCNRVRLPPQGILKTCLCYSDGADLREILRADMPEEEKKCMLRESMREAILRKPDAHCFESPEAMTENAAMNAIGG